VASNARSATAGQPAVRNDAASRCTNPVNSLRSYFLNEFTEGSEYNTRAFLNRSGRDITDHYIRNSALGELQLAEQKTIGAHLVKALGRPRRMR
jgi:hypothetical protein